jgi:hypothetical protein
MRIKKKPLITIPNLKKKVQVVFNSYIRERDKNPDGTWTCISCGQTFDSVHSGHYFEVPGWGHMRYEEMNVHAQCAGCNLYRNGNLILYRRNLIKKIGESAVQNLEERAIKEKPHWKEWEREKLETLLEIYKSKLNQIKNKQHEN